MSLPTFRILIRASTGISSSSSLESALNTDATEDGVFFGAAAAVFGEAMEATEPGSRLWIASRPAGEIWLCYRPQVRFDLGALPTASVAEVSVGARGSG